MAVSYQKTGSEDWLEKIEIEVKDGCVVEVKNGCVTVEKPAGKNWSMSRQQKLTLAAFALSDFTAYLAYSVIAPFFPQEATAKGASDTVIGFIFGSFELVICIVAPIYGSLITRVGPKFMFVSGTFIGSVCIILFGFLDRAPDGTVYIVLCFICRMMNANGTAMLTTASFAIVAKEFPNQRSIVMGILEACVGIGLIVGPTCGGVLYAAGGYWLPFIVVGAVQMISCVVSYFLLTSVDEVTEKKRFLPLFKIPNVILAFMLIFSATFALSFLDPTLSKQVLSIDPTLSPTAVGAVFLAICATYAIASPLIGWLCDKGFLKSMLVVGCFLSSASLFCLGPSPLLPFLPQQMWLIVVSLCFFGFGYGASWLPTFQLILNSATKNGYSDNIETYGMVSGLFGCGSALGAFSGPSAAGYLCELAGFGWAVTFCAFLTLIMGLITLVSLVIEMKSPALCFKTKRSILLTEDSQDDERKPLLKSTKCLKVGSELATM